MPRRPWLSSALSILIVLATAVALYRPEVSDAPAGPPVAPAPDGLLDRLETPTRLPEAVPRPELGVLDRPDGMPPRHEPISAPSPILPAPSAPPPPLTDPVAWWITPPDPAP